jgi:hypothetical protein
MAAVGVVAIMLGGCDIANSKSEFKSGFYLQTESCEDRASRYKEGELNCASSEQWKQLCEEVDIVSGIDATKILYDNIFSNRISMDGLNHIFNNGRQDNIQTSWNDSDGSCYLQYSISGTYEGSEYNLFSRKGSVREFFVGINEGDQYVAVLDAL